MRARSFSHVGITVSDFNTAVQFYWDVFGCPLVGVADTPPDRVRSVLRRRRTRSRRCKIGWIACPAAAMLEIFEFQPQQPPAPIPWNRVGLTHISLQRAEHAEVARLPGRARASSASSTPERSPRGHSFFFAKDFDGNLIEMMDLGYMYHVLQLARAARRLAVPARDVQAVLRRALKAFVDDLRAQEPLTAENAEIAEP